MSVCLTAVKHCCDFPRGPREINMYVPDSCSDSDDCQSVMSMIKSISNQKLPGIAGEEEISLEIPHMCTDKVQTTDVIFTDNEVEDEVSHSAPVFHISGQHEKSGVNENCQEHNTVSHVQ